MPTRVTEKQVTAISMRLGQMTEQEFHHFMAELSITNIEHHHGPRKHGQLYRLRDSIIKACKELS